VILSRQYFYDNGTIEYLTCSISLMALILPIKSDTLSALPSVTNISAQLSPPPTCKCRLPSTISSYSCLRCKSTSMKGFGVLSIANLGYDTKSNTFYMK
jgi:hypothetical protein